MRTKIELEMEIKAIKKYEKKSCKQSKSTMIIR